MTNHTVNTMINQSVIVGRKLLQNEFICPISDKDSFDWLSNSHNFQFMNEHLSVFGVQIVNLDDSVFCGVNVAMSDDDKNKVVKMFYETLTQLKPLIDLLVCLSFHDDGEMLYLGKTLKHAELYSSANQNKEFELRLQELMQGTSYANKPNDIQIDGLLKRMKDDGLVVLTNPNQKIYKVTGKIIYINRIIAFISENYIQKEPEMTAIQEGLDL